MKKILITSLAVVLPLFTACQQETPENRIEVQEEQVIDTTKVDSAEVINSEATTYQQKPAELQDVQRRQGSEEVEYTTKRQVTQTLLHEAKIPTIQTCESKADINRMKSEDFQAIGFDQNAAQKIIQARDQQGNFQSVDDLSRVQGISQDTFAQVKQDLGVQQKQAQEAQ